MDDDDLRDYAEEAFNRDYCDHCGTTHDENMHLEDDAECEGHESLHSDSMGLTVYCDGSCRR